MTDYIFMWLAAANLIAFLLMVFDKAYAKAGMRRTRESTLLLWAFLGGALGTMLAALLMRHKTRKQPFATWMLISLGANIILLLPWALGLLGPFFVSALAKIAADA
ncbi:DUF1294 domain-containing protein [Sphingopyxis flava]|uniref:Uncharacterized membrane protein YsdA, DUF1294 family n=1 Tax=Sphingopyxis flava TaxID=1507287 RepID=A0A1T4ZQR5_9SPHN|nr:DUF1294 domain-containing protein [Sphingopyxis flava]SKB25040.1 Uncharacterized membrane protein YsdA, DUF1294 family [Sphingopyxis flava]